MIRSTFAMPAIVALLSLLGLLVALTGEGWPDVFSWAALSAPVLTMFWAAGRRFS